MPDSELQGCPGQGPQRLPQPPHTATRIPSYGKHRRPGRTPGTPGAPGATRRDQPDDSTPRTPPTHRPGGRGAVARACVRAAGGDGRRRRHDRAVPARGRGRAAAADHPPAGAHAGRPRLRAAGALAPVRPRPAADPPRRDLLAAARAAGPGPTWPSWSTSSASRPTWPCSTATRSSTSARCPSQQLDAHVHRGRPPVLAALHRGRQGDPGRLDPAAGARAAGADRHAGAHRAHDHRPGRVPRRA